MKNKLYLVLVLSALTSLVGWTAHAQLQKAAPQKQVWEYMEVELYAAAHSAPRLNEYGSQGWELVGVTSICPSAPDATIPCRSLAYLKRSR